MAKQGYQLDNDAVRRTGRVVQRVEQRIQGTTGRGRGGSPEILGLTLIAFTLTEDMGNTTASEASATLHKSWDAATETYTGSDDGVVVDPGDIFDEALSGAYGKGYLRPGNDRTVVDPVVIGC